MFSLIAYYLDQEFNKRGRRTPVSVGEVIHVIRTAYIRGEGVDPGNAEVLLGIRRLVLAQIVGLGPPLDGETQLIILDRGRLAKAADAYVENLRLSGDRRALAIIEYISTTSLGKPGAQKQ